jgi:hypothetical protein
MSNLTLTPDGRLQYTEWHRPSGTGGAGRNERVDVTANAEQYLHECLTIAPETPLSSVFKLVLAGNGLPAVLKRLCAEEISREGLAEKAPSDGGIDPSGIEHVCVYRAMERNSTGRTLGSMYSAFHGVGPVLEEDVMEGDTLVYRKGDRAYYAFSFTSPQRIRDLPLLLDDNLVISETNFNLENFWEKAEHIKCTEYTLMEVLFAIFWELTYNDPSAKPDVVDQD